MFLMYLNCHWWNFDLNPKTSQSIRFPVMFGLRVAVRTRSLSGCEVGLIPFRAPSMGGPWLPQWSVVLSFHAHHPHNPRHCCLGFRLKSSLRQLFRFSMKWKHKILKKKVKDTVVVWNFTKSTQASYFSEMCGLVYVVCKPVQDLYQKRKKDYSCTCNYSNVEHTSWWLLIFFQTPVLLIHFKWTDDINRNTLP